MVFGADRLEFKFQPCLFVALGRAAFRCFLTFRFIPGKLELMLFRLTVPSRRHVCELLSSAPGTIYTFLHSSDLVLSGSQNYK